MPKLTKRTIDAIEPLETEFFLWDEGIPGFGLRVIPSGRKSFVVQFRAGRRARRMSLGPSTVLTCDQARTRAITIIAAVKNGEDPAADRAAKRKAATVNDPADCFDKEHIAVRLKASTAKEYRGNLRRFILPAVGRLAVPEITRVWARRGTRPRAKRDTRYQWSYIFGAVCPARGVAAGLVLPFANTEAMNAHLAEIARTVAGFACQGHNALVGVWVDRGNYGKDVF